MIANSVFSFCLLVAVALLVHAYQDNVQARGSDFYPGAYSVEGGTDRWYYRYDWRMTLVQKNGEVRGLDVGIAQIMTGAMQVRLVTKILPFDELLPALDQGRVDVVISNMIITQKCNMIVAFVGPYLSSGKCIITRSEVLASAEKSEEFDTPETRLAVQKGSASEEFVRLQVSKATAVTVDDPDSGMMLVSDSKVDGRLTGYPVCILGINRHPDAGFISPFLLVSYKPIGIAQPANDARFINWTRNFLKRLDETGTLHSLGERWLGETAIESAHLR